MFTVRWHIHSNFLQEPTWSRAIVVVTNTQLLNLLKQSEKQLNTYNWSGNKREENLSKCYPSGVCWSVTENKTKDEELQYTGNSNDPTSDSEMRRVSKVANHELGD